MSAAASADASEDATADAAASIIFHLEKHVMELYRPHISSIQYLLNYNEFNNNKMSQNAFSFIEFHCLSMSFML